MANKYTPEQRELLKKKLREKKIKEEKADNLFKKKGRIALIIFLVIQAIIYRFILGISMGWFLMIVVYFITSYIVQKRITKNKLKNIYTETILTGFLISLFIYLIIIGLSMMTNGT